MNGKKSLLILATLVLCAILLAGMTACGRDRATTEDPSAATASSEAGKADGTDTETASASASADPSASASPTSGDASETASPEASASSASENGSGGTSSVAWPKEFDAWGIPTIKDATLTFADNKSAAGNTLTSGVTASVIIDKLTRKQFDAYTKALLDAGFEKAEGSIDILLQAHEKTVPEGVIRIMLTHEDASTSIIVTHSGAGAIKDAEAKANAGKGPDTKDWPDALKAVPLFPAGAFKEMLAMGGNFFTLTWLDVTQADWDAYTKTLEKEGYAATNLGDTTGYIKMDGKNMTNVSGILADGTLQIVVVTGTME